MTPFPYNKYGASEKAYHHLRPNNLIMWEAIKWCAQNGFKTFSLGRTEPENEGLLQFKQGWGTTEKIIKEIGYFLHRRWIQYWPANMKRLEVLIKA